MPDFNLRPSFITEFYGEEFFREFGQGIRLFREPCTSSEQLVANIVRNEDRGRSCFTSIYNYRAKYLYNS